MRSYYIHSERKGGMELAEFTDNFKNTFFQFIHKDILAGIKKFQSTMTSFMHNQM